MITDRYPQRQVARSWPPESPPSPPSRSRSRRLLRWAGFWVLVVIVALGVWRIALHVTRDYAAAARAKQVAAERTALRQQLTPVLDRYGSIQTAVATFDLKTNIASSFGSQQPFVAASITKLTTATYFLHLVEAGQQSLNQQLDGYPASWQLQQMVQESNNDSWALLDNLVGYQELANFAHRIGLTSFNLQNNTITASDETILLQKLYTGKLLNRTDTNLLLSYMQHTNDETLIPAALPAGATVYHKYGEIENEVNDAAIINEHGRSFILVIFTNQSNMVDYTQRTQLIHALTQATVRAFN